MSEGTDTDSGQPSPDEERTGIPAMPTAAVPRDRDGVLVAGATLVLGCRTGILSDFFVAPAGKLKRSTDFPRTADGWSRAWREFESGDPTGAANYRRQDSVRQRTAEAAALLRSQDATPPLPAAATIPNVFFFNPEDAGADAFAVVPGCILVTGYTPKNDASPRDVTLYFFFDRIEVRNSARHHLLATVLLQDVLTLRVDGPGAQSAGGGFVGGGIGLVGAAGGMFMAAALNALTTVRTVQTFIELHEQGRHCLWVSDRITPRELELLLRPVHSRIRELRIASDPGAHRDPLDRLEKLETLRASGVLTEVEFASAKATILADLSGD